MMHPIVIAHIRSVLTVGPINDNDGYERLMK